MAQDGLIQTLVNPNARKRPVQQIAATTASSSTTLSATTAAGETIPKGALYVLQGATDFRYDIGSAGVTVASTNVKILADQQEYVQTKETDGSTTPSGTTGGTRPVLSVKCETANGALNVFAVW